MISFIPKLSVSLIVCVFVLPPVKGKTGLKRGDLLCFFFLGGGVNLRKKCLGDWV